MSDLYTAAVRDAVKVQLLKEKWTWVSYQAMSKPPQWSFPFTVTARTEGWDTGQSSRDKKIKKQWLQEQRGVWGKFSHKHAKTLVKCRFSLKSGQKLMPSSETVTRSQSLVSSLHRKSCYNTKISVVWKQFNFTILYINRPFSQGFSEAEVVLIGQTSTVVHGNKQT